VLVSAVRRVTSSTARPGSNQTERVSHCNFFKLTRPPQAAGASPLTINIMDETTSWNSLLEDHPIFKHDDSDLAASLNATARRQLLALKDSELFLAVGTQIRVTSLSTREAKKSYKVCSRTHVFRLYVLNLLLATTTHRLCTRQISNSLSVKSPSIRMANCLL
jgi:hypothetical protein